MSEVSISSPRKFVLPFSVLSEKREKTFTPDMELAAVFSVAELNRRKRRRLLLRRNREKIAFVAKMGYPLWMFPFQTDVLLFDGLNVFNRSFPYTQMSNVRDFADELEESCRARETYAAFLASHNDYFAKSAKETNHPLGGLISDVGFLSEMDSYRREADKMETPPAHLCLLSSKTDESRLETTTREIEGLQVSFQNDVKDLNASIQLLEKTFQTFHKELHDNVKAVKDEFALKIKTEEATTAPKVKALRDDYDQKTIELAKNFANQQLPLHTEKLKLKKTVEETEEKITQYNLKAKASGESEDALAKERWKQQIKDTKQELSTTEKQLKNAEKALEDMEKNRVNEASRLKLELENGIKEARKNIVDLEASRDAKILMIRQEMDGLEKQTKLVTEQIGTTVKLREASLAQLGNLHLKPFSEELNKALVYVPFYVMCYSAKTSRRYLVLPPSIVGTIDISTKLKGALGKARVKSLLLPRFKNITSLAENIQELIRENTAFELELKELGDQNNILATSATWEDIEQGLLSLKEQGWLSDKDYGAIMASARTSSHRHP